MARRQGPGGCNRHTLVACCAVWVCVWLGTLCVVRRQSLSFGVRGACMWLGAPLQSAWGTAPLVWPQAAQGSGLRCRGGCRRSLCGAVMR